MVAVLGRYRVLKHLASGGMADVLLGRSDGIEGFERHVVLKRIRAEHARDQRFISMFIDEARLAAGLHHQSIVQVFDIGETDGDYFFAMEYIHGEDLRTLLSAAAKARTHIPLGIVCAIVSATASALHYAHERRDAKGKPLGIVHRDVSPSNVLVGYDGSVKVVDFGIAKATLRQSETLAGSLKGKCSYMSPEQCKGEAVDRRSDVYGLGVLLYELATTSRLFKGDNEYLVMDAIANGRFALPQVRRPDLPNELSSIIMRALAVDPRRRYQTAEELRIELDELAARSYGTASTAALASYMRKMFGVRPEPWLDLTEEPEVATSGQSWTDASGDNASRDSRRSARSLSAPVAAATMTRAASHDTASTQRFGWEAARRMQAARGRKLPWLVVPLLAIAGIGVWQLVQPQRSPPQHESSASVAASSVAPATPTVAAAPVQPVHSAPTPPAAEPAPAAAPTPAADPTPVADAARASAPIIPPPVEPAPKHAAAKLDKKAHVKTAAGAAAPASPTAPTESAPPSATIAAAPPSASSAPLVVTPVAAPAPAAAPTPVAPPAAPAVEPVAAVAPPQPKLLEQPMPVLSNATVAAVASDHSAQLAKCERGATLRGDVAVSFQIDGNGKVVKSQLSLTIKNPKVAACILKAVQSWKFARPPAGRARGVYSISYQ